MYTEVLAKAKQRYDEDLALIGQHPRQPEKVMERMAERNQLICIADCLLEENAKLKGIIIEEREISKVARSEGFWRSFHKACDEVAEKYPLEDDEDDMTREQEVLDTISSFHKRNIGMETWQIVDTVYELAGAIAELRKMVEGEPFPAPTPQDGDEKLLSEFIDANRELNDKLDALTEEKKVLEAELAQLRAHQNGLQSEAAIVRDLRSELHQARIDLELQHEINKNETVRKENDLMKEALRRLLVEIDKNPAYAALRPGVPASETLV